MTFYESNPEVRPIGDDAAEFIEAPDSRTDDEDESPDDDPRARRTGEPPLASD